MEIFGIHIPVWLPAALSLFNLVNLAISWSEHRAGALIALHQGSRFATLTRDADTMTRIIITLWWGAAAIHHWHGGPQTWVLYDTMTLHLLAAIPCWSGLRITCRIRFRTWDLWVNPAEASVHPAAPAHR